MFQSTLLSFRDGVSIVKTSATAIALECPLGRVRLDDVTPGVLAAVGILSSGGATEDEISDVVLGADGGAARVLLRCQLAQWGKLGLIRYTVLGNDGPLISVVAMAPGFQLRPNRIERRAEFRLSRFAYCRRDQDAWVLESPLSLARTIIFGGAGVALIADLALARTYPDLCARNNLCESTVLAFLGLLVTAAVVSEVKGDGALPEDDDWALAQWEFHDLLFHARSRLGRHDYPIGGTYPFLGKIPPLPAVKPEMSKDVIALYAPDVEQLKERDLPFTRVLENRRSVREYGNEPITANQLGEFLYRTARVRRNVGAGPGECLHYEVTDRPYPSGGASYDMELYVTVSRCSGIYPGIYHYHPLNHSLYGLAGYGSHAEALLRDAQRVAGLSSLPQVLITLASRFPRLSWKYRGLAYATTLKNVGVLYQTMYLVATAMGLAPCGLGAGNSALLAEAIGTCYVAESSVGEFILGSAPG